MLTFNLWALEDSYHQGVTFDVPYREQAIIISKNGFYPNRITVFKGEKVRFFVTAVGIEASCFNIPDKNIFSSALPSKISETETFFDAVGVFQFNCPNHPFNGRIMVLDKASDREIKYSRGLASDNVKIWKPKDLPSEWVQIKRDDISKFQGMGDFMDLDKTESNPNMENDFKDEK